ncbi:hypothetical protein ACIA8K_09170 [Catenuloplanes sp. NPDC051500]|uniref:hypothetical protein n=1 Tax=Catenuloplanes sp. NPDC051500 TaxID=3363959 RepID=UPI0037A828A1
MAGRVPSGAEPSSGNPALSGPGTPPVAGGAPAQGSARPPQGMAGRVPSSAGPSSGNPALSSSGTPPVAGGGPAQGSARPPQGMAGRVPPGAGPSSGNPALTGPGTPPIAASASVSGRIPLAGNTPISADAPISGGAPVPSARGGASVPGRTQPPGRASAAAPGSGSASAAVPGPGSGPAAARIPGSGPAVARIPGSAPAHPTGTAHPPTGTANPPLDGPNALYRPDRQRPDASGGIRPGSAQASVAPAAYRSGAPGTTNGPDASGAYGAGPQPDASGGHRTGAAFGQVPAASGVYRPGQRPEASGGHRPATPATAPPLDAGDHAPGTDLASRTPSSVARLKQPSVVPSQPGKPESLAPIGPQRPAGGTEGEAAPAAEPRKPWQMLVGVLAALVLVSVCGLSSFFILADERNNGRDAQASNANPQATSQPRDITSRGVDGEPLTTNEVFPADTIAITPQEPPYQVLKTEQLDDCGKAAAGDIPQLLIDLGCNQVVRGTMRSPDNGYLVTAGVFNLEDETGAKWAHEQIKAMVDGQKGRFSGLNAGAGTEAVELSSAQVGWNIRGHYLAYCVIARADGEKIIDGDPDARRILYDMVELHLRNNVLEKRATQPLPK